LQAKYDSVLKAKQAAAERTRVLDSKRKKLKEGIKAWRLAFVVPSTHARVLWDDHLLPIARMASPGGFPDLDAREKASESSVQSVGRAARNLEEEVGEPALCVRRCCCAPALSGCAGGGSVATCIRCPRKFVTLCLLPDPLHQIGRLMPWACQACR